MNNKINIRPAQPEETDLVLEFIKKLAVYEKCADEVVANEATLYHSLFVERSAEVVFAEEDGVIIGFAFFSITSRLLWGAKVCILKTYSSFPRNEAWVMAKLC